MTEVIGKKCCAPNDPGNTVKDDRKTEEATVGLKL